jgi:hypothetical protein
MSTDLPHWGPSGATVTFVAGRYQATVSDSTGAAFYRLNKP